MSVTKSDLIEQLSLQANLPKGKAEVIVNVLFDSMVAALQRGERIEIRGFGSFEVRNYRAYEGRNPRTGEPVHVNPKRLPFFKVGKELRERVNRGASGDTAAQSGHEPDTPERPEPSPLPRGTEPAEVSTFAAPGTAERIAPAEEAPEPAVPSAEEPPAAAPTPELENSTVEY